GAGRGRPLTSSASTTGEEAAADDRAIHERDLAWLQQADVVVAEVTQPSLGVSYELDRAVALEEPVLGSCCHGAAETNPTRNHEVLGLIPGVAPWVKEPALP
uniref:Uncharacterized protein n=1 Tax=Sus scrofa TaxID=9823 RepID=A0A8D1A0K4_PIG